MNVRFGLRFQPVDALLQASYPTLMASAYDEVLLAPALELMTKANILLLTSGTYYVAESPGAMVIGCGGWSLERPGSGTVEPNLGHIRHFYTHPDWRNRSIGRAIFRLCETKARSAGITSFESIRRTDIELGPNAHLPAVVMRRRI